MSQLTSYIRWHWYFPILLSSIFLGFLFWTFSSMIFHTFSIGFISWLCWGYFITAIPSSSRKLNTVLALWQGALSCINNGVSNLPLCKWGSACWRRSFFFFIKTDIKITVKTNNGSYSRWRNHPHTITLPRQISQFSWRIEDISVLHFYVSQTSYHRSKQV